MLGVDSFAGRNESPSDEDQIRNEGEDVVRSAEPRLVIDDKQERLVAGEHVGNLLKVTPVTSVPTFGLLPNYEGVRWVDALLNKSRSGVPLLVGKGFWILHVGGIASENHNL
jgi:hypothetical protein